MTNFIIGLMVGGALCVAALTHHPVIAKTIHSLGGDVPAEFIVTCQADDRERVDCKSSDIEREKNHVH